MSLKQIIAFVQIVENKVKFYNGSEEELVMNFSIIILAPNVP